MTGFVTNLRSLMKFCAIGPICLLTDVINLAYVSGELKTVIWLIALLLLFGDLACKIFLSVSLLYLTK